MSVLYLVRHGQASFGQADYDRLSPLGERQAELAGQYHARLGSRFGAAYCGTMERQKNTAARFLRQLSDPPALMIAPEFNEYDSKPVLTALGPELARRDQALALALPRMLDDRKSFQLVYESAMRCWVEGRHGPGDFETWPAFLGRVQKGLGRIISDHPKGQRVLLFTSGGPISAVMRAALGLADLAALEITWVIKNASVSSFLHTRDNLTLSTFNSTAHLDETGDPELITYR